MTRNSPGGVRLRGSRSGASRNAVLLTIAIVMVVAGVLFTIFNQVNRRDIPVLYASDIEHFKYGSIGSDSRDGNGFPYWIWLTLPQVCPDLLPGGWGSLGVVMEEGMNRPIGFSMRKTGFFDSVGLNCASCHTGTVRETPESEPSVYLAASSHQLDLWGYFSFLFSCAQDDNFTSGNVLAAIDEISAGNEAAPGFVEKLIYRLAVGQIREQLTAQAQIMGWVDDRPLWGPGRVDTFNPYKTLVFGLDMTNDQTIGTADFMTIWNQGLRDNLWVHWDGNNNSVDERNYSAAIGAGASPESLEHEALARIKNWIWNLQAPRYPFEIDVGLAATGQGIYQQQCAFCHDTGGSQLGEVFSAQALGVDTERADAFDDEMAARMNTIGEGYDWQFRNFRSTDGYASHPLDGVWLRAPYLHNGSVPTLRDLLEPEDGRPLMFYRGYDVFDQEKVGFVSDVPEEDGKRFFEFDTSLPGNHGGGHLYGIDLTAAQKSALVEYLKTL